MRTSWLYQTKAGLSATKLPASSAVPQAAEPVYQQQDAQHRQHT